VDRLRIAYDATPLLGNRTGIGNIAALTLNALATDHLDTLDISAYAITWRGRQDLAKLVPAGVHSATRSFPARLARSTWLNFNAPKIEYWTGSVDVVHATCYATPPSSIPTIISIHDLAYHYYPELCTPDIRGYPKLIERALDHGAVVHTISSFVAGEVRDLYGLSAERVVTIAPGILPSKHGAAAIGHRLAGSSQYLLAVGTIEPRKNLPALIRAFDVVADERSAARLVVAGVDGWGVEDFERALDAARHRDRIVRLGYVSERDRNDLLAGATALVYPSLYEGLGLPPLEALQAGIPVVASSAGSLVESLGDAALFPDPRSDEAIAAALAEILDDSALRATLVDRGSAQLEKFSWSKSAKELADLYQRVATR